MDSCSQAELPREGSPESFVSNAKEPQDGASPETSQAVPMGEPTDFLFEVDSSFEVGLVGSLTELALADDNRRLIDWLVAYRAHELDGTQELHEKINRLTKIVEAFASFHRSYKESLLYRAARVSETYLEAMRSALSKFIRAAAELLPDGDELTGMFEARQLGALEKRLKRLVASDPSEAGTAFLESYRRELEDTERLLSELVRVLVTEYNRRIELTRKRLRHYLQLLAESEERMKQQHATIERSVEELDRDGRLHDVDRGRLREAFAQKREELAAMAGAQSEKRERVASLLGAMRESLLAFSELAQMLRLKLLQYKARKDYVGRLVAVDTEVPELSPILNEVRHSLLGNVENIERTFLLFNEAFQNTLLTAIEKQALMNRIQLSAKGRSEIAFEIAFELAAAPSRSPGRQKNGREAPVPGPFDLSFLASIDTAPESAPREDGAPAPSGT